MIRITGKTNLLLRDTKKFRGYPFHKKWVCNANIISDPNRKHKRLFSILQSFPFIKCNIKTNKNIYSPPNNECVMKVDDNQCQ